MSLDEPSIVVRVEPLVTFSLSVLVANSSNCPTINSSVNKSLRLSNNKQLIKASSNIIPCFYCNIYLLDFLEYFMLNPLFHIFFWDWKYRWQYWHIGEGSKLTYVDEIRLFYCFFYLDNTSSGDLGIYLINLHNELSICAHCNVYITATILNFWKFICGLYALKS